MTPQAFIEGQLKELNQSAGLVRLKDSALLEAEILRLLLVKKFRKYSASKELIAHCKKTIAMQVAKKKPINLTFLHGAYKLWRLDESPWPDWAELFALMYYTNWMKGICEIYEPGVWFDFFVDDLIVPKLNNVPMSDVEEYIDSYKKVLDFVRSFQPDNLEMTITSVSSRFDSAKQFEETLEQKLKELEKASGGHLPELTEAQRSMIELNVKITPEQKKDPKWREKVWQLHEAYLAAKRMPGYHTRPEKIWVFTQPLPSTQALAVGTTKASVVKFWVGVGALKHKDDAYQETILSPAQLEAADFEWVKIKIEGLKGRNFERIREIK